MDPDTQVDRRGRRGRWDEMARDVLVAVAAGTAAIAALTGADEVGAAAADVVAATLLVLAGAALAWRRRRPLASTLAAVAITWTYLALGYPGGPELPIQLVAFFALAAAGRRREVIAIVVTVGGGGLLHRAVVEREGLLEIVLTVTLLVLAALLGDAAHTRRLLREEVRERLRAARVEQELEARARVTEERLRIARELHDVVAHTIATMTVQAGAAADLLDTHPEDARRALGALRGAARDATAELHATLGVLRRGDAAPSRRPAPGLGQLADLVDGVRRAGVDVELAVRDVAGPLPNATALAVQRIVQEALTNALRHAPGARIVVNVHGEGSQLIVRVDDDGARRPPPAGPATSGHGLHGLDERVRALGGSLRARPRRDGGFRVEAVLPRPIGVQPDRLLAVAETAGRQAARA